MVNLPPLGVTRGKRVSGNRPVKIVISLNNCSIDDLDYNDNKWITTDLAPSLSSDGKVEIRGMLKLDGTRDLLAVVKA